MNAPGLSLPAPQNIRLPVRLLGPVTDVWVLTRRNLIHIAREPMQLSDVTVQPLLFTLLFVYIFGSGIPIPGGGSYADFAVAGLLAFNISMATTGTSVGLSSDLTTGVITRFRTLPMRPSAILAGRSATDMATSALCAVVVALIGLAVGWRPEHGLLAAAGGIGIAWLFGYALSWVMACVGLVSKGPESASAVGILTLFPIAFVSNALVPVRGMPAWLRDIVEWNPLSAVTTATRKLFGNPDPAAALQVWPMQHPVVAALAWSAALLTISVPLAATLFRRRTVD
jgi:ABC-2 type transport system permease protein